MPSLAELLELFEDVPVLPPPVPRQRQTTSGDTTMKSLPPPVVSGAHRSSSNGSFLNRVFRRLWLNSDSVIDQERKMVPRKPNPFQMLKLGKKMVVVAVVDAGMISFFRFAQGVFEEWPMI